jgi:glutathionylspermidine synthase
LQYFILVPIFRNQPEFLNTIFPFKEGKEGKKGERELGKVIWSNCGQKIVISHQSGETHALFYRVLSMYRKQIIFFFHFFAYIHCTVGICCGNFK